MPIRRRLRAVPALAWMVLIAVVLRVAVIPFDTIENLMDANHIHAWEQGNVARSLLAGHGFGSPFLSAQPSAIMPPIYPLIVAAFFYLFGIHTAHAIFAIHAFDCVINALACIPIFFIARRMFGSRVAMGAAWAWVFFPYGIYFAAAWAWSTHLLLLGLCVLLCLAPKIEETSSVPLWALFGTVAGLTALAEPSVLVVVAFLLTLAAYRLARGRMRWLQPGAVASLALLATLSPWLIRDALVFHRFIPMRDSIGLELWMGNNGYSERFTSDQLHPLHDTAELAAYNVSEVSYMAQKKAQAEAYIGAHPRWFVWMSMRRAIYLWTGYWSFDKAYLEMEPTDPENVPFATAITLLAAFGLFRLWRHRPSEAFRLGGVLFLFPVIYYFTHPEPYHLRPLDPLLVMCGCHSILRLRERVSRKQPMAHPRVSLAAQEPIGSESY